MSAGARPPLIVHIIYRLDVGGLENGLVNLINHMPPARYRHAIVCLAGYSTDFRKRIRRDDVEVVSLDKRPGKDLGAYWRAWRALRVLRPALVHTRNLGTVDMQWVAAAAAVGARVHGEHGWEASDPQGLSSRGRLIRRACRPVIQRYIAMSRDLADWMQARIGIAPGRIRQIYNGVDTSRFTVDGPRAALEWPPTATPLPAADVCVIGTVGRLDPVKNQLRLLDAFARLRESAPEARQRLRLVVVGRGPMEQALRAQVASLGLEDVVLMVGSREDVPELMRAIDVFVLPSLNEGISNTILEAMASGLPVVAGRVGGNPELIQDGVTGALCDLAAPGDLERSLSNYVKSVDMRRAHGAAGRERAIREFSLQSMVQNYLGVYDACLSPEGSGGA